MTNDTQDLEQRLVSGTFVECLYAAYQLAQSGSAGCEILAAVGKDMTRSRQTRISSLLMIPLTANRSLLEALVRAIIDDEDVAIRYHAIRICVGAGLFHLAPLIEGRRTDSASFSDMDMHVRISELAESALELLYARTIDPTFPGDRFCSVCD